MRGLVAALLGALMFPFVAAAAGAPIRPADPKASARTRDVLAYLWLAPERKTKRLLYGQYAASEACCNAQEKGERGFDANLRQAEQRTGRTAAIVGIDYNEWDFEKKTLVRDYAALNALAIPYADQGSLITVGYHAANPWTNGYWSSGGCPGAFGDLVDPAKPVHAAWRRQLGVVADGLTQLQHAGATVLWRPFLEMNGDAHWWWQVCRPTPAEFRAVWKDMFDYLTAERGLHNLLWVYAPLTQVGGNRPALELYPGEDVVDVVGYDTYHDYAEWPDYATWKTLRKVLAYTERGPHSADGKSKLYVDFLDDIEKHGWSVSFFQAWSGPLNPINNPGGARMIKDPRIADQADARAALACMASAASGAEKTACVLK